MELEESSVACSKGLASRDLVRLVGLAMALLCLIAPSIAAAQTPLIAKRIATGMMYSCAIDSTDRLVCWGVNWEQQMGSAVPSQSNRAIPSALGATTVQNLWLANATTCVRTIVGNVVHCFGANWLNAAHFPSGAFKSYPNVVTANTINNNQESFDNYYQNGCFITSSPAGNVRCWGDNNGGMAPHYRLLGSATPSPAISNQPVIVPGVSSVTAIATGIAFACVITTSAAKIKCWGTPGPWHTGTSYAVYQSNDIVGATQIGASSNNVCAIVGANNDVLCWGAQYGSTPIPVAVPGGASQIGVGNYHGCALNPAGSVYCWGSRLSGATGDATAVSQQIAVIPYAGTVPTNAPQPVVGLSNVAEISIYGSSNCARKADGTVRCWGFKSDGACTIPGGAQVRQVLTTCAPPTTNGACGSAHNQHFTSLITSSPGLCTGTNPATNFTPFTTGGYAGWNWTCPGSGGGTNAMCRAINP